MPPAVEWTGIDFVVFDVDGTLYDQGRLRRTMARDLLLASLLGADVSSPKVLAAFRRRRETMAEEETKDFEGCLVRETAAKTGRSEAEVTAIVERWLLERPLRHLARCRYAGVDKLFAGLRRAGKRIGILSDYPAQAKLNALGLAADHIVAAGDLEIGRLKPHPRGLQRLMEIADVSASRTILIGDRYDRDGRAAERAGTRYLIRTSKAKAASFPAFERFDDAVFAPVLG
jgi:HAD superfamily hydrolase (TIGR01549 family)